MNRSLSFALKYGVFIAIALIGYFLLLRIFDLHERPLLRLLNGLFMGLGIFLAIKSFKTDNVSGFTYVDGFKTGLLTGFIATGIFIVFMAVYIFHLDTEFPKKILADRFGSGSRDSGLLILVIVLEGLASTAVLTLACMQLFKKSNQVGQQEELFDDRSTEVTGRNRK